MTSAVLEIPGEEAVEVDDRGYLLDPARWTPRVAETMASNDGIQLGEDHWEVLRIFRSYYDSFEIEPPMRALVKLARERMGDEKGCSRHLYRLFPDGPGTQACRYAGLPRPLSCV